MFPRFRQTEHRLQVSLVETRRVDGKVQHEHVAGLGSVDRPPSVEARVTFWQRLHQRLAKLGNRVDAAAQARLLGEIHARVPMVTLEEQQALKLENAKADERFWDRLTDLHAGTVEDHKGLIAAAERKIAAGQAEIAKVMPERDAAKDRRKRLERGEDVSGGLSKPFTREDAERILREAGFTASDIQHSVDLHTLAKSMDWDTLVHELHAVGTKASDRAEKAAVRAMLRTIREQG